MISPYRIKYAGIASDELNIPDLITCVAMDSDNGESQSFLNRESVASESYDGRYKRIHHLKYTETFSPKITFMKPDFEDFSTEDVRAVMKWLTMKDTTALLEVFYDDSNVVSWASIGGFVDLQTYKLANNRIIGITAVWDSISPFAYSDLYTYTQNTAVQINTTMHYWTSETISGPSVPQYVLTNVQTPKVGTEMYAASRALTNSVIDTPLTFFGSISSVNADGSYVVNETTFKLTHVSEKTKQTYDNKITINIDTDDNKPVYPKLTIYHGYNNTPHTIVSLLPHITFNGLDDMKGYVENTIYHNSIKNTYYWFDKDGFHSQNTQPNLSTTSVKIINQHYDFFGVPSAPTTTIIKNNTGTEKIVLDGANKIISSDRIRRIFGDDFNLQHLELYDGKNEIIIEGNCEVTIEYRTAIKIGEY